MTARWHKLRVKPDVGTTLGHALSMTTSFNRGRVVAADVRDDLLDLNVTGDFVVKTGADPEKVVAALEKILRKEVFRRSP